MTITTGVVTTVRRGQGNVTPMEVVNVADASTKSVNEFATKRGKLANAMIRNAFA